jgi:hypothetical protein
LKVLRLAAGYETQSLVRGRELFEASSLANDVDLVEELLFQAGQSVFAHSWPASPARWAKRQPIRQQAEQEIRF